MKPTAYTTIIMLNIILALSAFTTHATIVDGISYIFDEIEKTAMVTSGTKSNFFPDGNVVIPETIRKDGGEYRVVGIDAYAFHGCKWITSTTMPNTITFIGESAFWSCEGLTSVTIPNSVTTIDDSAFENCSGLISVTFNAERCTQMGSYGHLVFNGCKNLTSLTIGNKVSMIPSYAFSSCSKLSSVIIPNSVTYIGAAHSPVALG